MAQAKTKGHEGVRLTFYEELKGALGFELNQILPTTKMSTSRRREYCLEIAEKILPVIKNYLQPLIEQAQGAEKKRIEKLLASVGVSIVWGGKGEFEAVRYPDGISGGKVLHYPDPAKEANDAKP